jgi:hypothetical protein
MENFSSFLLEFKTLWIAIQAIAIAVGLGAATVTDITFFNFLRDGRINLSRDKIFRSLMNTVWIAAWIALLGGLFIFLGDPETYSRSIVFSLKTSIIGVLLVNGIIIRTYIQPRLQELGSAELRSAIPKHVAFASAAISLISWYVVFLLDRLETLFIDMETGLLIYGFTLILVVSLSQICCNYFQIKAVEKKNKELQKQKEKEEKRKAKKRKKTNTKKKPPTKKKAKKKTASKKKTTKKS